jgi:UDP-N-acetylglucosamine 1-carboxyvinyltransferase
MKEYKIEGGRTLSGHLRVSGNKNAALPCIAAALLTDEPVVLRNVPDIEDVRVMLEIFCALGGSAKAGTDKSGRFWRLSASNITSTVVPAGAADKIRASMLFAGPLLGRCGKAALPPPGGDIIGRRPLDTHINALLALGCKLEIEQEMPHAFFFTTAKGAVPHGADVFLEETSVTATENTVMAGVLAKGCTTINNAASEPHVRDLCNMLASMGADIDGIGSNVLHLRGVKKLHGTDFTLGADYMEAGSLIALAAVTKSELFIDGISFEDIRPAKAPFEKLGIKFDISNAGLHVGAKQKLRVRSDFGGMIPKIEDAPWPGFPPDLTSIMTVAATQTTGTVLVHEKMFESRMFFVDMLISMGARIILCDPHRAVISGPAKLKGATLTSPDVRAGMAMMIAAMCAEGKSTIRNVYQIERGYENIASRLRSVGAKIEVTD